MSNVTKKVGDETLYEYSRLYSCDEEGIKLTGLTLDNLVEAFFTAVFAH